MAAHIAEIFNAVNYYNTLALTALEWGSTYRPDLVLPTYAYGPAGKIAKASAPQIAWVFGSNRFTLEDATRRPRSEAGSQRWVFRTRWQSYEIRVWAPKNVISPVRRNGSMNGHLSFTVPVPPATITPPATASGFYLGQIIITTPGAVGTAQFTYSLDGGVTMSAPLATGANIQLGTSQIFVTFAAPNGPLALNDFFAFTAYPQQVADYATGETMAECFIQSIHNTIPGSYQLGEGMWSGSHGEEMFQQGSEFVFEFQVRTPMASVLLPADAALAQITSAQQTDIIGSTSTTP